VELHLKRTSAFLFSTSIYISMGICICIRISISMDTTAFSFLLSVEFSRLGFLADRFWYTIDMTSLVGIICTKLLGLSPGTVNDEYIIIDR
jgi:hypothetical protein